MTTEYLELDKLERQIDELLRNNQRLRHENEGLRSQNKALQQQYLTIKEGNQEARQKVTAMIQRLQKLEESV